MAAIRRTFSIRSETYRNVMFRRAFVHTFIRQTTLYHHPPHGPERAWLSARYADTLRRRRHHDAATALCRARCAVALPLAPRCFVATQDACEQT